MIGEHLAQLALLNPVSFGAQLSAQIPPAEEILEAGAALSLLGGNLAKEWVGNGVSPVVLAIDGLRPVLERGEYERAAQEMKKIATGLQRLPEDLLKRASDETVALLKSVARKNAVLAGVRYGSAPMVMMRLRALFGSEDKAELDSGALPPHVSDLKAEIASVAGSRAGIQFENLYCSSQKRPRQRNCNSFFSLFNRVKNRLHPSALQMFVAVFAEKWPDLACYLRILEDVQKIRTFDLKNLIRFCDESYAADKGLEFLRTSRPELFTADLIPDFVAVCGKSAAACSLLKFLADRFPDAFDQQAIHELSNGADIYRDAVLVLSFLEVHYALLKNHNTHLFVLTALGIAAEKNRDAAVALRVAIEVRSGHHNAHYALARLKLAADVNDGAAEEVALLRRKKPGLFDTAGNV